jgi:DNA-binding Xre family transcriptional regulator
MPFYSSYPSCGKLINCLKDVLQDKKISSFKLSKLAEVSPTTTRKIYSDERYIPSPDVLERICLILEVQPGDILKISPKLNLDVAVCSGVLSSGLRISGPYLGPSGACYSG